MIPILRRASSKDVEALEDLLRSIGWFHIFENEAPEESLARLTRLLRQALTGDSHSLYVAEALDGRLDGYCAVHWLPYLFLSGPEGFISELFVRPSARGVGLGGLLLAQVEEEARTRGCARLHLLNNRDRDSYLRGFYAKHGYEERPMMASFVKKL